MADQPPQPNKGERIKFSVRDSEPIILHFTTPDGRKWEVPIGFTITDLRFLGWNPDGTPNVHFNYNASHGGVDELPGDARRKPGTVSPLKPVE